MAKPKIIFCIIVVFLIILIFFRYYFLKSKINNQKNINEEVVLIGKIVKEPDIRDENIKLVVKAWFAEENQVFLKNKNFVKVLITVDRYPEYKYGETLKITGKIQEPMVFEDFNYKNYLKKDGISGVVYYPKIETIYSKPDFLDFFMISTLKLKNKLRERLHYYIPFPQSYILSALILGDKNKISDNFKEKLNISGLRHLTAVSGLHIVVLSSALMSFFEIFFKKTKAVFISLSFILFFIVLTGFQISSIRAFVMGSLFLIAPLLGKKSFSLRSVILTALFILLANPFLLFYDMGFQLSFLAVLGIVLLSPIFNMKMRFISSRFSKIREIASSTFSAYIFTLPILVYNFGQVSFAGFVSNLLILPIVPFIMVSGLLFIFLSVFLPFVGFIFSFIVWFILSYVILVIKLFSQPFFVQRFEPFNFGWVLISYIVLFSVSFYLYKKNKTIPWFLN